jgi:AraC-like DNA-binding protein
MPIYMDVHIVPGVRAKDVAEAHRKDLLHEGEFACKCMTYWIDEQRENIFCLIEAPNKEAVEEMHNRAHGLIPNKIIEVNSNLVETFLGRIYDPRDAMVTDGLKVFSDPSFRYLMVTKMDDPVLIKHRKGAEQASEWSQLQNESIRNNIQKHEGREAEHSGTGFIASFTSAAKAIESALAISKEIPAEIRGESGLRIALHAGEPVENRSNRIFGDTIDFADILCKLKREQSIGISTVVKEVIAKEQLRNDEIFSLSPPDENHVRLLFSSLDENFHDPEFDIENYSVATTMSRSQLYRKTVSLTGQSPNQLLKDYRLDKAKDLLKKQNSSIAQVTYETGFTSPSYFTKCFKKRFGLLPMAYLDLL